MNQMVTISYEDQLKAQTRARRLRLMGKPKVVNVAKEVIKEAEARKYATRRRPRAYADAHVRAWEAYHSRPANRMTIEECQKQICEREGFDFDLIMSHNRQEHVVDQRDFVIFEVREMFPNVSKSELARRFGKDHSCIHHSLNREAERRGIDEKDLTSVDRAYPTLREDIANGLSLREIANKYGVGSATIGRKVRLLGLSDQLGGRKTRLPQHVIDAIEDEYLSGKTGRDICRRYHISQGHMRDMVRRYGWSELREKARAQ
ncbi:Chromosomal replication initiator protein DnaA [Rhizobium rhizogenes]|uniref:Chromosomal replication initiator protein DnaA n=1 Tax=Rhizobium rhizogenes TaxID=359 RepID=A0AAN2DCR9_RHIRH|nr:MULTISPECIES: helix-turn-helix domain-containing protein [Rhizobium/Agrobacterium group]AQS61767.1 hypothetical protein B0909_05520 [Rhizobium rhizogenes]MCZ7443004.1 hypothetical protein [Rhizobium rhizogenes]NSZ78990.1 hypothetical protein [Agrobacterium tumefaciens]OAM65787.1 hypothetical protein A8L48_22605 [Rhizobium rhizogenes]CAD0211205.1 Chromosomal replication initiator protein DnaA [Rhizobium rhizogenes]